MIHNIKLEDIDPSFLEFKPSKNLPVEVLEKFNFHFNRQKEKYVSYKETERHYKSDLPDIYLGAKFLPIFSHECDDVWQKLYENDKEATIKLSSYIGSIGTFLSFSKFSAENSLEKIQRIQVLKEKFAESLWYLKHYGAELHDDGGWDYFDEESQNRCIQCSMHYELEEAIEAYVDRLLFIESHRATEEEATRNKEAYPVSRKRNVENAEAVFFAKILNQKFLLFFGKPYHDHVATFINAVFGTCYDYAAIAQIVRKR